MTIKGERESIVQYIEKITIGGVLMLPPNSGYGALVWGYRGRVLGGTQ
jgi:hypothetical protein